MSAGQQPNLLEIGCGSSNALLTILDNHPNLGPSRVFGTSLSPLPAHALLKECGLQICPDVMAEDLPAVWTSQFNIVMASVVMQWTNLGLALPQIFKVMCDGAYFISYDTRSTVAAIESRANQLANVSLLPANPSTRSDHVGFVIQKLSSL